jgi:hypothetical protein
MFRRCAREHYFSYGLRRAKRAPKKEALTKGLAVHGAVGAHHRHEPVDLSLLGPDLRALYHGYVGYWTDETGRDRMIDVERTDVPFRITIEGIQVQGELDGVGVRRDTGKRVIIEHKTSSEDISTGSAYWQKVSATDAQVSIYLAASAQKGWGQTEVLYDVLWKPRLRLKKDETEQEFEGRVLEDIANAPEKYYQRATVVRLEYEHDAHFRDLVGTVHLMQAARAMGPHVPRNVDSCFKWGSPCEFWAVCGGGADISDDTLFMEKPRKPKKDAEEMKFDPAPTAPVYQF